MSENKKDKGLQKLQNFNIRLGRKITGDGSKILNFSLSKVAFKAFKWISIAYLPVMLFIVLVIIAITAIAWSINSESTANYISNMSKTNEMARAFPEWVVEGLIDAISRVLYSIFIIPLSTISDSMQTVIVFLSGGPLMEKFLEKNSFIWIYLGIVLLIGVVIGFTALSFNAIRSMISKNGSQEISAGIKMVVLSVIIIPIIPFMFFSLNYLVNEMVGAFLLTSDNKNQSISLLIFNSSFESGFGNWTTIPLIPPMSGGFNSLVCLFGLFMVVYILFMISMYLLWRVAELIFMLVISPIPVYWGFYDGGISFGKWKDSVIGKLIGGFAVYIAYSIYLASIGGIVEVSALLNNDGLARGVFLILSITAFGIMVVMSPTIITMVLNTRGAVADAMAMNMSQRLATNAYKEGVGRSTHAVGLAGGLASGGINAGVNFKKLQNEGFGKREIIKGMTTQKMNNFKHDKNFNSLNNYLNKRKEIK